MSCHIAAGEAGGVRLRWNTLGRMLSKLKVISRGRRSGAKVTKGRRLVQLGLGVWQSIELGLLSRRLLLGLLLAGIKHLRLGLARL